jgi:hypothetical protein
MKKQEPEIEVIVTFSEGWEERFAAAQYKLWKRVTKRKLLEEIEKSLKEHKIEGNQDAPC